jgi:dTDP-4-dehydrorhamnose reductase
LRILITGASGLLGSKIAEVASKRGFEVYSGYLTHFPTIGKPVRLDVSDRNLVHKVVRSVKPDAVIHCAALTDVDKCEVEKELAMDVNVKGTKFIAQATNDVNAYLVMVSTDYVFEGSKGQYGEGDEPHPINFYGYSKLMGEGEVQRIAEDYLIARTSSIYGSKPANGKVNFALWLINNLRSNKEIKALVDQYVSPTLNTNLGEMVLEACEKRINGIYHLAGAERASRYDFALKLADALNLDKNLIKKANMSEMKWVAKRPKDSSLDVSKAKKTFKANPLKLDEALNLLRQEVKNV